MKTIKSILVACLLGGSLGTWAMEQTDHTSDPKKKSYAYADAVKVLTAVKQCPAFSALKKLGIHTHDFKKTLLPEGTVLPQVIGGSFDVLELILSLFLVKKESVPSFEEFREFSDIISFKSRFGLSHIDDEEALENFNNFLLALGGNNNPNFVMGENGPQFTFQDIVKNIPDAPGNVRYKITSGNNDTVAFYVEEEDTSLFSIGNIYIPAQLIQDTVQRPDVDDIAVGRFFCQVYATYVLSDEHTSKLLFPKIAQAQTMPYDYKERLGYMAITTYTLGAILGPDVATVMMLKPPVKPRLQVSQGKILGEGRPEPILFSRLRHGSTAAIFSAEHYLEYSKTYNDIMDFFVQHNLYLKFSMNMYGTNKAHTFSTIKQCYSSLGEHTYNSAYKEKYSAFFHAVTFRMEDVFYPLDEVNKTGQDHHMIMEYLRFLSYLNKNSYFLKRVKVELEGPRADLMVLHEKTQEIQGDIVKFFDHNLQDVADEDVLYDKDQYLYEDHDAEENFNEHNGIPEEDLNLELLLNQQDNENQNNINVDIQNQENQPNVAKLIFTPQDNIYRTQVAFGKNYKLRHRKEISWEVYEVTSFRGKKH